MLPFIVNLPIMMRLLRRDLYRTGSDRLLLGLGPIYTAFGPCVAGYLKKKFFDVYCGRAIGVYGANIVSFGLCLL